MAGVEPVIQAAPSAGDHATHGLDAPVIPCHDAPLMADGILAGSLEAGSLVGAPLCASSFLRHALCSTRHRRVETCSQGGRGRLSLFKSRTILQGRTAKRRHALRLMACRRAAGPGKGCERHSGRSISWQRVFVDSRGTVGAEATGGGGRRADFTGFRLSTTHGLPDRGAKALSAPCLSSLPISDTSTAHSLLPIPRAADR